MVECWSDGVISQMAERREESAERAGKRVRTCVRFVAAHDGWAMQTRRRLFVILIGVAVLVGVVAVVFRSPPEPKYRGKKLSEWISVPNVRFGHMGTIASLTEPAQEAVARIGTNGVPLLMSWV